MHRLASWVALVGATVAAVIALSPRAAFGDPSTPDAPADFASESGAHVLAFSERARIKPKHREAKGPMRSPVSVAMGTIGEIGAFGGLTAGATLILLAHHPDFLGIGHLECEIAGGVAASFSNAPPGSFMCVTPPVDQTEQTAGIVSIVSGLVLIGVSTPLIVYGAHHLPAEDKPRPDGAVPTVSVGPGSASLRWDF